MTGGTLPATKNKMSEEPTTQGRALFKRVPVIVRSWDGPNSRIGVELDLGQMPWGPFDALGKRLSLLLPATESSASSESGSESQVERALRHVEHAADRCGEFAQLADGNEEIWLRSQETWEFIRRYLTSLWIDSEVDGKPVPFSEASGTATPQSPGEAGAPPPDVPSLPGAASTLRVAAQALKATPLAHWREAVGISDPEAPTREEAVQTLLGVARIIGGLAPGGSVIEGSLSSREAEPAGQAPPPEPEPETTAPKALAQEEPIRPDPDQLSFDFAQGYDEGYQMGRKVGLALGARRSGGSHPSQS